jgi:PhnB protein
MSTTTVTDTRTGAAAVETQLRALLEDWTAAHREKDAARVLSLCTHDIVQFIMAPPLEFSAAQAWDREAWFSSFDGPLGYEIHNLRIATGEETAFCYFLNHLSAHSVKYGFFDMWNRVTLGFARIEGRWLITHVHSSVPFYMDGSLRAAVDLKP